MSALTEVVGWTLVHFVWQGGAIAGAAAAALWLVRHRPPNARYLVSCAGLTLMLMAPVVTATWLQRASPPGVFTVAAVDPLSPAPVPLAPAPPSAWGRLAFPAESRIVAARTMVAHLLPLIVLSWLAGVVMLLSRVGAGWWQVKRLHGAALASPRSSWHAACRRLAVQLRLSVTPHVVESRLVEVPTVLGWMQPVVVLPVAALANLTPGQVEAILAHELAHIRRHDYAINVLQTVAETVLFYHPCVWWVSARIRAEREHCCDDVAVGVCGDAINYAHALVELETRRIAATSLALAATDGSLFGRITRILRVEPADESRSPGLLVTVALTVFMVAGAGAFTWVPGAIDGGWSRRTADTVVDPISIEAPELPVPPEPPDPPQPPDPPGAPDPPDVPDQPDAPDPSDAPGLPDASEPPRLTAALAPAQLQEPREPREPLQPREPREPRERREPREPRQLREPRPTTGDYRMNWSNFGSGTEVRGRGDVTFKPDLSDVESLSPGGYLSIRTWSLFIPRTIEIRSEGGRLTHRYYVAGLSRPYDDEARRWLASELSTTLVRRVGLGAESRTRQILAAGGVPAVLEEIHRLEVDHVRGRYLRELFRAPSLGSSSLVSALALAARAIRSDFELSRTLRTAAPAAALQPGLARAYVDTAGHIESDFEQRRALVTLLRADRLAAGTGDLVLQAAARLRSDFEKGIVLRAALQTAAVDRAGALVPALRTMRSDFEKRRVVGAVMADADLNADARNGLLAGVAGIESDFECATALIAFANTYGVDGATADAFFAAVGTIDSAFETRRVLTIVAKKTPLAAEGSRGILETVRRRMRSDFERAELLLAMIDAHPLDAPNRSAIIAAAGSLGSTFEQNRVLAALVKAERR